MHQLRQFLRWLAPHINVDKKLDAEADPQDQHQEEDEDDTISVAAPAADTSDQHHAMLKETPPFHITEYIVRIERQKRGYPHAHILLWMKPASPEEALDSPEAEDVDWSDEEACRRFVPKTAEELSDKFICTKSPASWQEATKTDPTTRQINAKLAEMVVHRCSSSCGRFTLGACRFGFPRSKAERTRRRDAQEMFFSRWKSSLTARRQERDSMMGQYNAAMLRMWRASMDIQVICELTSASRYILGYTFKSEEDFAAARRMQAIIEKLATEAGGEALNAPEVYRAAHAALQGRTTSTFEACHLLLGFPVVEFSRDNVWIQVGPPQTWTLWVPQREEAAALKQPDAYFESKQGQERTMPVAQRCYQHLQQAFAEQETDVPVEGSSPVKRQWKDITFFDFCAGFRFIGKEVPVPRKRPAIVGYRNFSPDLEPEAFYYSKLLLHLTWTTPGEWLQPEDMQSHAAAFQRVARDREQYPTFLQSVCLPNLDGTVEAARKLQTVQAVMYMKAKMAPAELRDGWSHSRADEQNYQDALKIMEALRERHGGTIDFMAPDFVPTGPANSAFAPVEGGEEAFSLLTTQAPETERQLQAMQYIVRTVTDNPNTKAGNSTRRLRLLLHGPGGCGKSVVVRAAAHMLRKNGKGVIIAAPTGVAACNVNGVTLHQCMFLPVVNRSYGKACDAPLPRGAHLAALQEFWARVSVLMVDEISFISAFMFDRIDKHLRMARNMPDTPFGGLHVIFSGDLYQLPPPGGHPCFCSSLWCFFELCELQGNQRAAEDPEWAALLGRVRVGEWTEADIQMLKDLVVKKNSKQQPAAEAVHLYATRKAVAEDNQRYLDLHLADTGAPLYECPAVDISVKTGAPLAPELAWAEPENTGGLEGLLRVAVGVRVMLRFNIDVHDKLVNGACGTVTHIDAQDTGEVEKIWIKFEGQAGALWCGANETHSVALTRRTAAFQDQTDSRAERKQFPLVLAKATTIHKSQAATAHQGAHSALDSTVTQEGQAYVALSRCPTRKHCTLRSFNRSCLRFNAHAEWALTKLREQQADKPGSELWCNLMRPPHGKEFYTQRLAKLPRPNLHSNNGQDDPERPWHCPKCGEATAHTKSAMKAHKRVCPAAAPKRARAKAKATTKHEKKKTSKAPTTPETASGKRNAARWQNGKAGERTGKRGAPDSPADVPAASKKQRSNQASFEKQQDARRGQHTSNHALGGHDFQQHPPPSSPVTKAARTENPSLDQANKLPESSCPESCYFEPQEELRCGIHALNHALGGHFFNKEDLEHAATTFLQENWELGDNLAAHMGPGGDYSIEVLLMAVRTKSMQAFDRLCWHMSDQRALRCEDLEGCFGAIQNHGGQHWVALRRCQDGHFFHVDSLRRPELLTPAELEATLLEHPTFPIWPA